MARWRSSAAYRIAFMNFGAYAAGLALLGLIVLAVTHVSVSHQLDAMVAGEAQALQEEYARGGDAELAKEIAEREASRSPRRMLYGVFDSTGHRLYGSLIVARPRRGLHRIVFNDPGEGPDEARAAAVDLSAGERLVVAVDSDALEDTERLVVLMFGLAFGGFIVIGFAGATFFGAYLQRRLQSISGSAEAIVNGDIRQRLPVGPRNDEFDQLAATLNRMFDRIEALLDNLRQVSTDIAHDLRTPLARLRNLLEAGSKQEAGADGLVPRAIEQLDEALSLFAAILRLSEIEGEGTRRFFTAVDISAMLTDLAESYAIAFEDQKRTLLWSIDPGLSAEGDRELLAQAIVNLLENAQRHTPPEVIVRLSASAAGAMILMQVADNGPGIPKADLDRVTKRFARLERSRNTAGHGLGLSLVSAVAKLHGGRLVLRHLERGLSATVQIPQKAVH